MNRHITGLTMAAALALTATGAYAQTSPMQSHATVSDSMKAHPAKPSDTRKATPVVHDAMAVDAMKPDAMAPQHPKSHAAKPADPMSGDHMSPAPAAKKKQ